MKEAKRKKVERGERVKVRQQSGKKINVVKKRKMKTEGNREKGGGAMGW